MKALSERNNLTTGVVWKKLLLFFFPILLGLLFQQLYNTVDAVIVGRFVGSHALAAVGGSAAAYVNVVIGFFTGLNTGATVAVAQKYGAGDHEGLTKVLHTAFSFSAFVGIAMTLLTYLFAPALMRMTQCPEDVLEDSVLYLRIYMVGAAPLLIYNLGQGSLQALGDSRTPLIFLIASTILNIILDYLFVAVFSLGVAGVAWASVISMVACTLMVFVHMTRLKGPGHVNLLHMTLNGPVLSSILRIGIPAGITSATYGVSNLIIQSSVNSFGTDVVAAWAASGKVDGVFWVCTAAFGTALCAFIGQCFGAGLYDRMKQGLRSCLRMTLSLTAFLSTILMLTCPYLYPLFVNEEVAAIGVRITRTFAPGYVVWAGIEAVSACFRGVGDTFRPMIINIVGTCLIRVLWMIFVVPRWHTVFSVSIIYIITWVLTLITYIVYYFKVDWMPDLSSPDQT